MVPLPGGPRNPAWGIGGTGVWLLMSLKTEFERLTFGGSEPGDTRFMKVNEMRASETLELKKIIIIQKQNQKQTLLTSSEGRHRDSRRQSSEAQYCECAAPVGGTPIIIIIISKSNSDGERKTIILPAELGGGNGRGGLNTQFSLSSKILEKTFRVRLGR